MRLEDIPKLLGADKLASLFPQCHRLRQGTTCRFAARYLPPVLLAAGIFATALFPATPGLARADDMHVGPVTALPLPRYVSTKVASGRARRGPSLAHRIDWVFTHRAMPLRIIAEHGHWRRVEDRDGLGGWIHYTALSGVRTVIVEHDMLEMRARPRDGSRLVARLEQGVIAQLGKCNAAWCHLRSDRLGGWARRSGLWGVDPGEVRD